MANPLTTPSVYDTALIAGVRTPGQCDLSGAHAPRKWDVWRGFGLSGAATVFTGIDIKSFALRLIFWEASQIDEYNASIVPILALPPRGKRPKALSFYHPYASDPPINIHSVGVEDVTQLQQIEDGKWAVDIQLIPYFAPKPAVAKPIATDDGKPKAEDAYDRKILELDERIQQLTRKK